MSSNITGSQSTAIGYQSLTSNIAGNYNSAFGTSTLRIGTTGSYNTANGFNSLYNNTGDANSTLGANTLTNITSGGANVACGYGAGQFISGGITNAVSADNSIFLGSFAYPLGNSQTNQIVIGYNSSGLGSDTTVIGNNSTTHIALFGNLLLGSTANGTDKLQVTGNSTFTNGSTRISIVSTTASTNALLYMQGGTGGVSEFRASSSYKWTYGTPGSAYSTGMVLSANNHLILGTTTDYINGTFLQVTGNTLTMGNVYTNQGAPVSLGTGNLATGANIVAGLIQNTGTGFTLPAPTSINTAFYPSLAATANPVRASFDWSVINTYSGACTIATNGAHTALGSLAIAIGTSARFRTVKTGISTYVTYRIA